MLILDNKVRFILGVVHGEIIVNNRKRADLFMELQEKGFTPYRKKSKKVDVAVAGATDEVDEMEDNSEALLSKDLQASDYEYLLSMAIGTLTLEKVQQLCADKDKLIREVDELRKATPEQLWLKDLRALEEQLDVLFCCFCLTRWSFFNYRSMPKTVSFIIYKCRSKKKKLPRSKKKES